MSEQAVFGDGLRGGLDRLSRAVDRLEGAIAERERAAGNDAARMRSLQAEAAAMRAMQRTLAEHLDAAIARLKTAIGE
ncbi:MAG: DUF4164 family protein [Rhodospirillales bacterium]|nr:DUF4164 family protein [Rhodospirillales bacterium]